MRTVAVTFLTLLALTSASFGQDVPKRQYVVRPPLWLDVTVDNAIDELKADEGKPEYSQRWVRFDVSADAEVYISTAVHGVVRWRLTSALINEVEWKYTGETLRGTVPDHLVNALATSEGLPSDMRKGLGPGLPVSLNPNIEFSVAGTPIRSAFSPYPSKREVSTDLPKPYSPPTQEPESDKQTARQAITVGYSVLPKTGDYEFQRQDEYQEIGRLLADFTKTEAKKAEAVARKFLPFVLGNFGHQLLALDLNNTELERTPKEIQDSIDRAVEFQPQKFGFSSFEDYEQARDKGFRLSIVPSLQVFLPYYMNGGVVTFAMGIKIKP